MTLLTAREFVQKRDRAIEALGLAFPARNVLWPPLARFLMDTHGLARRVRLAERYGPGARHTSDSARRSRRTRKDGDGSGRGSRYARSAWSPYTGSAVTVKAGLAREGEPQAID